MESFSQGYRLQTEDLNTSFIAQGISYPAGMAYAYTPYSVSYEIAYYHPTEARYLRIGPLNRVPEKIRNGLYRANFIVGEHWTPGTYKITWKYRISESSGEESKEEEFEITSRGVDSAIFTILFCQRNLPARVNVLIDIQDLPASFSIIP